MVKAEQIRRKNKKSENRVADILPNNKTPMECTAQVEYKTAAKRQRKADTHKFLDGKMPVRCAAHPASETQGGILKPGNQRNIPESTEGKNCSHIEDNGTCGNECDGDARDTKLKIKPHKKVAWDLKSTPLQSSAALPDAVLQQDPSSGTEPLSKPAMSESTILVQNTDQVASRSTLIGYHEQARTVTSCPSLMSSISHSQEGFVTSTVPESTLKERAERIQELPTVCPVQQDVGLSEGKINDMEDLASTDADPNARIQELEDCVVTQALELVSQAKEIKSLVETVNELREKIQSSSDNKYESCKRSKKYPDEKTFKPQRE
ncbi:hypothetical protein BDW67DRAFT_189322 [Aspergillus spinulosporus]